MPYRLVRERDGAGDSGGMSLGLFPVRNDFDEIVDVEYVKNARPKVGMSMRVGSLIARTYQHQDWWQTTLITKILEDTPNRVKFQTGNSTYTWEII